MISRFAIIWVLCLVVPGVYGAETEDLSNTPGLTPAQASAWTNAQWNWAQAIAQYGTESPEATQAQVEMNTLGRRLRIQPPTAIPQVATPESVAVQPVGPPEPAFIEKTLTTVTPKTEPTISDSTSTFERVESMQKPPRTSTKLSPSAATSNTAEPDATTSPVAPIQ